MPVIESHNLNETRRAALDVLGIVFAREPDDRAAVVGLSGELGSGKTTFAKTLAGILGITETITSPTFVLIKTYNLHTTSSNLFSKLVHADAYRLENGAELASLGFEEILNNPQNLVLVEWPERVADILPGDMLKVRFEFVDENIRRISYGEEKINRKRE